MFSTDWAPTLITAASEKIIAKINAFNDFINTPRHGYRGAQVCAPLFIQTNLFPGNRTGCAVVTSQKLKVQNIDDVIIVQVC